MWEYSFLWVSNMLNIDFGLGNPSTFQINMLNNVNKFYISEILTKTLYNILDLIISRKKNKSWAVLPESELFNCTHISF